VSEDEGAFCGVQEYVRVVDVLLHGKPVNTEGIFELIIGKKAVGYKHVPVHLGAGHGV
jgi:hypothetical protein